MIFKGFSLKQIKTTFLEGESPTIKGTLLKTFFNEISQTFNTASFFQTSPKKCLSCFNKMASLKSFRRPTSNYFKTLTRNIFLGVCFC